MLFNTLEYARFLAVVFIVSWLLVDRRYALLLPWFALAAVAFFHPGPTELALTGVAGALSLGLLRLSGGARGASAPAPTLRFAVASLAISGAALTFLTLRFAHQDPITWGLVGLGIPMDRLGAGTWVVAALGVLAAALLISARKVRLLFILCASYFFYAHWDYRFLPLIWASSTADWWLARTIHQASSLRRKRLWLIATVVMNLGVLGFFKYANFGIAQLSAAMTTFGLTPPELALHVALPVGISFFTFESMSYVIDVYRGELAPQKSYAEYLAFVAFFPHLVAGPIVRPRDLLPQLAGPGRFGTAEASEGLFLIAMGLGKKILIGDYLALNLVDRVFDAPAFYSGVEVYAAVVGYALQIYCDFSGYTDIAIGSALVLGVRFPKNFDSPYKSRSITEFWRRWHISLSTWLRDYLYIPLGGNRKGRARTYANLLATMILGGLWHGAAWTFVAWGTLHGLALALHRLWSEARHRPAGMTTTPNPASQKAPTAPGGRPTYAERIRSALAPADASPLRSALRVLLTFHFVCICWVFFRANTFSAAWLIFQRLGTGTTHHGNLPLPVLLVLVAGLIGHYVPERLFQKGQLTFTRLPGLAQGALLFALAVALRRMAAADAVPFVYFQF